MAAELGRSTYAEILVAFHGIFAPIEWAVIERAGHLSNIERPGEFNRLVLDFLLANMGNTDFNDH